MNYKTSYIILIFSLLMYSCTNMSEEKSIKEDTNSITEIQEPTLSPIEVGKSIALKTKAVLGKNLLTAINSQGTEHAVSFCATQAIPLTDSTAIALNAKIKRVSDKVRNPYNKANTAEHNN